MYIQHVQLSHAYREPPSWVRNAAWELFTTRVHAHTHTEQKKTTPPVPCSMPEQAAPAPDAAVVFSADNLLPRMLALSFCKNVSHLRALLVREPLYCPHADYRIKVHGGMLWHRDNCLYMKMIFLRVSQYLEFNILSYFLNLVSFEQELTKSYPLRHRLASYIIVWVVFFPSPVQSVLYWYAVLSLCVVLSSSS